MFACGFLIASAAAAQMRGVHITLRMRLECKIVRRGQGERDPPELYEVMNEVVVDRGANPYLAKIECWERDTLITKVRSYALICTCCTRERHACGLCSQIGWRRTALPTHSAGVHGYVCVVAEMLSIQGYVSCIGIVCWRTHYLGCLICFLARYLMGKVICGRCKQTA